MPVSWSSEGMPLCHLHHLDLITSSSAPWTSYMLIRVLIRLASSFGEGRQDERSLYVDMWTFLNSPGWIASGHVSIFMSTSSCTSVTSFSPPVGDGVVSTCLAASLLTGTSHTFANQDLWKYDRYILPDHNKTLGVGDVFLICREVHSSWSQPLHLPVFRAQLNHIVAWGKDCVEFQVTNLNTGCIHHKPLKLCLSVVHLSWRQRISRFIWPFPCCSPRPAALPPVTFVPRHRRFSGVRGDRVPRDSDGLPIWHTAPASTDCI